jgi:hypothetical protein
MTEWFYYDRQGEPIEIMEWALLQNDHYKRIRSTQVGKRVWVSTVWLGLDHSFAFGVHTPIIFETMVFGGVFDQNQQRYAIEAEAILGHQRMVAEQRRLLTRYNNAFLFHPALPWWLVLAGGLLWAVAATVVALTRWWGILPAFVGGVAFGTGVGQLLINRRRRRQARARDDHPSLTKEVPGADEWPPPGDPDDR